MTIEIRLPAPGEASLYCRYVGQSDAQQVHLYLNPETRTAWCGIDPEIGGAVPMDVWHGRMLRWPIPCLTRTAAVELMRRPDVQELLARICDGHDMVLDDHHSNLVGRFDEDAAAASLTLYTFLETYDGDEVVVWAARDWAGYDVEDGWLGVTATTSDDDLDDLAERLRVEALRDGGIHVLEGLDERLRELRALQAD